MSKIPLNFYIDVSGQPTSHIYVGLASITPSQLNLFMKSLKNKYPTFLRNKEKGSKLSYEEIKKYLSFMNGNHIHMSYISFNNWSEFSKFLKNRQYSKEMIYASLYFIAFKQFAKKEFLYPITVCYESYLDIEKVKNYFKKIAKANNYNVQISSAYASQNEIIKIADIIAAAGRKLTSADLNLENYKKICPSKNELNFYSEKLK